MVEQSMHTVCCDVNEPKPSRATVCRVALAGLAGAQRTAYTPSVRVGASEPRCKEVSPSELGAVCIAAVTTMSLGVAVPW